MQGLLLDTHVLLWWLMDEPIESGVADRLAHPDQLVFVSAATIWEVSIKSALGKLDVDGDLVELVESDFESLPISLGHGRSAGRLPPHHRDPFDRMLIAQAIDEDLTLVSRDRAFAAYEVEVLVA